MSRSEKANEADEKRKRSRDETRKERELAAGKLGR
jgi:hypothetical protein